LAWERKARIAPKFTQGKSEYEEERVRHLCRGWIRKQVIPAVYRDVVK